MADRGGRTIAVQVVFATPDKQVLRELQVPEGSSVRDVLARSGLASEFPGFVLEDTPAGVWGRPVGFNHEVSDGDRVEFYRPLALDPREARRQLAEAGRTMGSKRR